MFTWTQAQETGMTAPLLNLASIKGPLVLWFLFLLTWTAPQHAFRDFNSCFITRWKDGTKKELLTGFVPPADTDRHFKDSMSLSDETCQPLKTSQSLGAHKSSDVMPQSGFFLTDVEPIILVMLTALDKSDCYITRSSKHFLLTSSALCMIWELSVLNPKQIHYLVHMAICKY